jgi:hypothetical protein
MQRMLGMHRRCASRLAAVRALARAEDGAMSNRLPILAAEIMREHAEVRRAAQMSVEHAIKAGEALIEAKGQLKHGKWLPWLRDNCEMSARTAQLYMQLAKHKDQIRNSVADLGLRDALELLDDRSDLEKALALEGENNALRMQLVEELKALLDGDPGIDELQWVISRAEDIERQAAANRWRAVNELGRLMADLGPLTSEGA